MTTYPVGIHQKATGIKSGLDRGNRNQESRIETKDMEILEQYRIALDNAETQSEIAAIMAELGFAPAQRQMKPQPTLHTLAKPHKPTQNQSFAKECNFANAPLQNFIICSFK